MTARFTDKVVLVTGAGSGIGDGGAPDEVAASVLSLASPESNFVVGHDLVVDGGATV